MLLAVSSKVPPEVRDCVLYEGEWRGRTGCFTETGI